MHSSSANTRALAVMRIAIGILFLIFAEYKVVGSEFTHGGFQMWINRFLHDGTYPFMAPLLAGFVVHHATALAYLTAYGELAIGLALTLGILVRAASACGFIYMLALLFSSNYPGPHAAFWMYFGASLDHSVLALCFFVLVPANSEAAYSVRALVKGRRSASD